MPTITKLDIDTIGDRHPYLSMTELLEVQVFMATCSQTPEDAIERSFVKLPTGMVRRAIQKEIARMRSAAWQVSRD